MDDIAKEHQGACPAASESSERNHYLKNPTVPQFYRNATADIWNHTQGRSEWFDVSARFLSLQDKLDVDITRGRPYNIETAEAIRELLEAEGMASTLAKFEGTLARLWYEARTLEQERAGAQAREAAKATKEAHMGEIKAELRKLRAQREKQASEDKKLVDEFVMVEESEVVEQWELVDQL